MARRFTAKDIGRSACATLNIAVIKDLKTDGRSHEEDELQRACIKWFQWKHPDLWRQKKLHHVPNGGHRTAAEAAIFSAMGVVPGVSDLMLTIPRGRYAGAFFELKSRVGKLSDHQEAFIESHEQDYYCKVVRTLDEFILESTNYLQGKA